MDRRIALTQLARDPVAERKPVPAFCCIAWHNAFVTDICLRQASSRADKAMGFLL
jgi:hypothetical protein